MNLKGKNLERGLKRVLRYYRRELRREIRLMNKFGIEPNLVPFYEEMIDKYEYILKSLRQERARA